jgi:Integrase core domain.
MNLVTTFRHLLVGRLRWLLATGGERDAEILALRHQILVLQRQADRPRFTDTDRTILAVLSTAFARSRLPQIMLIVQPKTVIGWRRRLVARHWTYPPTTRRGRPATCAEIRRLAIRLAEENPTWGYRRVHGELCRIGHQIAASTVWTILRTAGIDPTPGRTGPTWAQFIRTQAKGIIATDFACVDSATLRRFHLLFFIEIGTRRVHLGGITTNPTGPWTTQAARNFLMNIDRQFRFVVHDGAGQYASAFDAVFEAEGISPITTPPRAPRADAYAERWVRTLRHELLDRTIIWNEHQLRALLVDYIDHYNQHRPHRSLDQAAPGTANVANVANVATIGTSKPIVRQTRCGGLINEYRQAA